MTDVSDMELLRDYDRQGSEGAYSTLVQRHIHLVYSVALRHVGNSAHAEEITQAVFVILARKAATLRPDTVLAGWLHETTRLTSLSFRRSEQRRQRREQEAYMQSTISEPDDVSDWSQLAPLLDEALSRLGKQDRDTVMLRYFKNESLAEVAAALRVSEAAAQRRALRAVEKLRRFFTKRGILLPAAALTAAITANSIQAAPVALAGSVTAAGLGQGAAVGGSTSTTIKGALKLMAWTKAKTVTVAAVVAIIAAGTATISVRSGDSMAARVERILEQKMMPGKDQWQAGMDELWALGPKIIPALAAEAGNSGSRLPRIYLGLREKLPPGVRRYLPQPIDRAQLRQTAMHVISEFGPLAVRRAAPAVIAGLSETDDRHNNYAVGCLRWLLPESASAAAIFEQGLAGTNVNWSVPESFLNVDDSVWANFSEVVPLLTNDLGDAGQAYKAAIVLGRVGSNAAPAIPALIHTADLGASGSFPDAEAARWHLSEGFSTTGPHKVKTRQDDKGMNHNRAMAALALGRIGIATPEVRAALVRAWNAPDAWVRCNAAKAVALLGPAMTNDLPELVGGLMDPDNGALSDKLFAVWKIGPDSRIALETLRELAKPARLRSLVADPEAHVVGWSIEELSISAKIDIFGIDPEEGHPFLPEIANMIGHSLHPMEFLAEPSPFSNDVVRAVEPLLEQSGNERQSGAAYVILHHDKHHAKALAVLRRNALIGSLEERLHMGFLLFGSTGETNGMCPLIEEAFRDQTSSLGQLAGQLADRMGDGALPALPAIKAALWHKDVFVRQHAGKLVLKLAPAELPINETK